MGRKKSRCHPSTAQTTVWSHTQNYSEQTNGGIVWHGSSTRSCTGLYFRGYTVSLLSVSSTMVLTMHSGPSCCLFVHPVPQPGGQAPHAKKKTTRTQDLVVYLVFDLRAALISASYGPVRDIATSF